VNDHAVTSRNCVGPP